MNEDENQPAPSPSPVTGHQPAKGGSILRGSGKPTKEERRAANRAAKEAAELQTQVRADAGWPVRGCTENQSAPGASPVTGLIPAKERKEQRRQEVAHLREAGVTLPRGRPSEYSEEEADNLCAWIAEGGSLRAWCRNTGRAAVTVYGWMRENAEFSTRYARAHEDRADSLADELLDVAREAMEDPSIEGVAAAKLLVESIKWTASKLRPQKWGEKQVVQHQGAVNIRIGVNKPQPHAVDVVDVTPK